MAVELFDLWLPILLSAVFVFVVSSVMHMLLPIHKGDMAKVPDEDGARAALKGMPPGEYCIPHANCMSDLGTPEMKAKYQEGPVLFMSVMPDGPMTMGASLLQWFVLSVVVSVLTAYLCSKTILQGAGFSDVFQVAGTAAIMGYALGSVSNSIWKAVPWSTTFKFVFDGLIYGLVTGATMAWLWPAAA